MISTITSTQVYKQISPTVGKNMTHLFIYRLMNYGDLEPTVEEQNAIFDIKTLLQIYHEAVSEEYSFLKVNLMQKINEKCSCPDSTITQIQAKIFYFHSIIYNDYTY